MESAALISVGLLRTDLTGQKHHFSFILELQVEQVHENSEQGKQSEKFLRYFLKKAVITVS